MGKVNTIIELKNAKELTKELKKLEHNSERAVNATISDFRAKVPSWVSQEVREVYGITAEAMKSMSDIKSSKKRVGRMKMEGETLDSLALIYTGRRLTPVHFNMSPKTPKEAYTLKAKIKGEKETLGKVKRLTKKQKKNIGRNFHGKGTRSSNKSPIMLMYTGNRKAGGTNYIPMQRVSQRRDDIEAIKTVSVPQMIMEPEVSGAIHKRVEVGMMERLNHHMKRFIK